MKEILDHFQTFPASTRDQLLRLVYGGDRRKIPRLNEKLLRLRDRGLIDASTDMRPYVYFAVPLRVHKRSNHLTHHLALVDFYLWLRDRGIKPEAVLYEPRFSTTHARPDLLLRWGNVAVCVELQRTRISQARMNAKMREYEELYARGAFRRYAQNLKVWVVTPHHYELRTTLDCRIIPWRAS